MFTQIKLISVVYKIAKQMHAQDRSIFTVQ